MGRQHALCWCDHLPTLPFCGSSSQAIILLLLLLRGPCSRANCNRPFWGAIEFQKGEHAGVAVGGNGGNAAANAIQEECEKQGVLTLVAACPKSIDSDILVVIALSHALAGPVHHLDWICLTLLAGTLGSCIMWHVTSNQSVCCLMNFPSAVQ